MPLTSPPSWLRAILGLLGARATGLWRVEGDSLVQVGFLAVDDMPEEVAAGFAGATLRVPLDRHDLGIVKAHRTGHVAVSRLDDGDPSHGSPYWLRRFEAVRSVAVPIGDEVLSVATSDAFEPDETWADWLRDAHRAAHAEGVTP